VAGTQISAMAGEESNLTADGDNLNNGWVKLWRQSLNSQVWLSPGLWQLWCYCLLRASHTPTWVSISTGRGKSEVCLEPGQFIFGRFAAAKDLKAKPTTICDRLKKLVAAGNVVTQNKAHYTLVTVCNWAFYQNGDAEAVTQPSGNRQATVTQPSHTRRVKKARAKKKARTKKSPTRHFVAPSLPDVKNYQAANPELLNVDVVHFWKSFNDSDWVDTRGNPVRNWKLKLRTWSKFERKGKELDDGRNRETRRDFAQSSAIGETIRA
jgi:hypothetical protein